MADFIPFLLGALFGAGTACILGRAWAKQDHDEIMQLRSRLRRLEGRDG